MLRAIRESRLQPDFNNGEFAIIKSQAGPNSVKEWVEKTHAIGLRATAGRYGGTFAHPDIAIRHHQRIPGALGVNRFGPRSWQAGFLKVSARRVGAPVTPSGRYQRRPSLASDTPPPSAGGSGAACPSAWICSTGCPRSTSVRWRFQSSWRRSFSSALRRRNSLTRAEPERAGS